jgi:hypothetical protein
MDEDKKPKHGWLGYWIHTYIIQTFSYKFFIESIRHKVISKIEWQYQKTNFQLEYHIDMKKVGEKIKY